jgi:hypothetical protein
VGITCPGERPWLGDNANEKNCPGPLIGALINQTNLYFPKTISAILLPDLDQDDAVIIRLRNEIENDPGTCGIAKTLWKMKNTAGAVALVQSGLSARGFKYTPSQIEAALTSLFEHSSGSPVSRNQPSDPESELLAFRRAEFNVIRNEVNDFINIPNLRVIPVGVSADIARWIHKVNLVERLRETRVFYGFERLEQTPDPLADMPDAALSQLFRNPPQQPQDRWLPAIEVFGEGIYLELDEHQIKRWLDAQSSWLEKRLTDGFLTRLSGIFLALPPLAPVSRAWAEKYLLVHSLSHILINQLVFECGYSTASLRERLYVSNDRNAPMAGVLIYTAAGDSEGTLGGLVSLGRRERLGPIFRRALSRASWCSADPVCSENLGGQGSRLVNLAACHACVLLPETSCETVNHGLDRATVVGTPYDRQCGFMSELLDASYVVA